MSRSSLAFFLGAVILGGVAAAAQRPSAPAVKGYAAPPLPDEAERMSLKEARRAIALLDRNYQSALRQIHRRFPVGNGQPVVAAVVVRDMQREVGSGGVLSSRFLAVGTKAMNPDHEPRDDFERQAVQELKRGARWVEALESGKLRVATVTPLGGGCFPCHSTPSGAPVQAAISWTVPIQTETPPRPGR
jgi:hypothetical protein